MISAKVSFKVFFADVFIKEGNTSEQKTNLTSFEQKF